MQIKESTKNYWKMQADGSTGIMRVLNMIHGYLYYTVYDHYVTAALFAIRLMKYLPRWAYQMVAIDFFTSRYHCKVMTHEDARKLISLDEHLVLPTEESKKIIPWEIANKLILKHKDDMAIVDCPCRLEKLGRGLKACEPIHTCVFLGKPGVDFATTHMPRMHAERATKEQVLALLDQNRKTGKVFTLWFKDGTGYRGGVLCSCCSCCCAAMEVEGISRDIGIKGLKITASSGYVAQVDREKCIACGKCVEMCHYNAKRITEVDGKKVSAVRYDFCMGCGLCSANCPTEAATLKADPSKSEVLDVEKILKMKKAHSKKAKNA